MTHSNLSNINKYLYDNSPSFEPREDTGSKNIPEPTDRKKSFIQVKKMVSNLVENLHSDAAETLITPRIIYVFRRYYSGEITEEQFQKELDYIKQQYSHQYSNK